ncbi:MAG: hypothetical protein HOH58_09655 [Opitutaceae bacterium]|jgi:hypothetical protein|nr:hypothetical protein [Opitutaceae bacterium]
MPVIKIGPLPLPLPHALFATGICLFAIGTATAQITADYHEVSREGMDPKAEGNSNRNWNFNTTALTTFNGWQYCAYWNNGDIVGGERRYRVELARRPLNSSAGWSTITLSDYYRNQDPDPPHSAAARFGDGHEKVSIGISPDGFIHLVFDLHVDHLHYVRSKTALALIPDTSPWNADQFEDVRRSLNPEGNLITRVTYPRFYSDYANDGFALHLRTGGSGSGDTHILNYDSIQQRWDIDTMDASRILDNETTAYPDGTVNAYPILQANGRTIHMLWTWRGTPDAATCFDIAHAYSTNFGSDWRNGQGNIIGIRGAADGSVDLISADDPGVTAVDLELNRVFNANFAAAVNRQKDIYVYYQDRQTGDRFLRKRTAVNQQDEGGSWGDAFAAPRVSNPILVAAPSGSVFLVSKTGVHQVLEDGSFSLVKSRPSEASYGAANLSVDHHRLESEGVISVIGQNSGQTVFTVDYQNLPAPSGASLRVASSPSDQTLAPGESTTLSVTAADPVAGVTPTFQWRRNGMDIAGATAATLTLNNLSISQTGYYTAAINDGVSTVFSSPALLTVTDLKPGRLRNLSVRSRSGPAESALVAGFVIDGEATEILVRGVGPGLSAFGVSPVLPDPELEMFSGQTSLVLNEDWATQSSSGHDQITTAGATVGAFALESGSKDAAILSTVTGAHTVHVRDEQSGIALAEIYEVGQTAGRLTNVSARTQTGSGADVLIAGFVIGGDLPMRVMLRAVGPQLETYGVTGVLANPLLRLYDRTETEIASNDDWSGTEVADSASIVGAFSLDPGSRDSALIATLNPGPYTAHVTGSEGGSGVALIELYALP